MARVSKTVDDKIKELYALLAKAAAQRAVDYVTTFSDPRGADKFVDATIHWLSLASAKASILVYDRPWIKS
jgi:hypothetical protein